MNAKEVSYVGEVWKDIKDYEDEYEISNLGRVRNKKTKKILKTWLNHNGYLRVELSKNGKHKFYFVHRLVYEAFIGEIPEGMQVNHKDENKQNNILSNIDTLMSPKQNLNYGTRNERSSKNRSKSVIQKSLDGKVIKVWSSLHEIQRVLGYSKGNISNCCVGRNYCNTAYGYLWQYVEEKATA